MPRKLSPEHIAKLQAGRARARAARKSAKPKKKSTKKKSTKKTTPKPLPPIPKTTTAKPLPTPPRSASDLARAQVAFNKRSMRSKKADVRKTGKVTTDIEKYEKAPNKWDWQGVDTAGSALQDAVVACTQKSCQATSKNIVGNVLKTVTSAVKAVVPIAPEYRLLLLEQFKEDMKEPGVKLVYTDTQTKYKYHVKNGKLIFLEEARTFYGPIINLSTKRRSLESAIKTDLVPLTYRLPEVYVKFLEIGESKDKLKPDGFQWASTMVPIPPGLHFTAENALVMTSGITRYDQRSYEQLRKIEAYIIGMDYDFPRYDTFLVGARDDIVLVVMIVPKSGPILVLADRKNVEVTRESAEQLQYALTSSAVLGQNITDEFSLWKRIPKDTSLMANRLSTLDKQAEMAIAPYNPLGFPREYKLARSVKLLHVNKKATVDWLKEQGMKTPVVRQHRDVAETYYERYNDRRAETQALAIAVNSGFDGLYFSPHVDLMGDIVVSASVILNNPGRYLYDPHKKSSGKPRLMFVRG